LAYAPSATSQSGLPRYFKCDTAHRNSSTGQKGCQEPYLTPAFCPNSVR
jgi:hypothetical protein